MAESPATFRFIGKHRRALEHKRFVVGQGRYAADIQLQGMLHVALVASPYASARIVTIDASAALAMPGVHAVLSGDELRQATEPMLPGVDAPQVTRLPLAVDVTRYAGEWVVAVVAESRALAEDAAELVMIDYETLAHTVDPEAAMAADAPLVHPAHGSNVIFQRKFVWGPVVDMKSVNPRNFDGLCGSGARRAETLLGGKVKGRRKSGRRAKNGQDFDLLRPEVALAALRSRQRAKE